MEDQASTSGHDAGSVGVSEVTPEKKGPSKKPTKGGHEADSVGQKNLSKKKLSFRVTTPTRRVTRSAKKAHGNVKKQTVQVAVSSSESDSSSEEEEEVEPTSVDVQPTKEQRRARHGISQKLPEFNGKPQDWPRFYGAFLASNKSCGFTNNENLVRLQECLKGPALELVRGRLITAESVPRVIEKLVQVYGRPELILHSLLKKVREVKAPKASDLTSFLPFSNAVEELCEHLEAAQLKDHLHNPLLIQELVDKLPDADKRAWSRFKRGHGSVSLRTLTDFLDEVVTEVLDTTLDLDITSGGIQHHQPFDGYKSFLDTGTAHLRAYVASGSVAAAAASSQYGGGSHHGQQTPQSLPSGPGSASKWEEPYFDDTTPTNVTGLVGKSAYLSCRVKNLGNKTVSWIRHRDIHILTVGSYTYTSDQRFQATHHKNIDDWTLQIKWAQKRDAGIYECQISTQPVRSFFVTLSVVGE
uniref:Ig-like domain-containing protein n=1 Tax=Anopheles stephensi TaxID=30069 RepID=A0A182YF63_ANOST